LVSLSPAGMDLLRSSDGDGMDIPITGLIVRATGRADAPGRPAVGTHSDVEDLEAIFVEHRDLAGARIVRETNHHLGSLGRRAGAGGARAARALRSATSRPR
jgi:hypothetical protein